MTTPLSTLRAAKTAATPANQVNPRDSERGVEDVVVAGFADAFEAGRSAEEREVIGPTVPFRSGMKPPPSLRGCLYT